MRVLACWLVLCSFALAEDSSGSLLIIGGGLLPNNAAVFDQFIAQGGGRERARVGIFPTASKNNKGAQQFADRLVALGIPAANIQIFNVRWENAREQAEKQTIAEQIRGCTGIYFAGGDQTRITRALRRPDETDTAALAAVRDAWRKGAIIAGSSAGAAAQSELMISVSGLPDESLDEGMDALDFGLTNEPRRRGLLVSRGLGFFRGGLIDQHFSQYRGRLARLARAAIERKVRFGFGIDENTAIAVAPDGTFEVIGLGSVTIVDSAESKCQDGPLGCRLERVRVSLLQTGDRFDPRTGVATPAEGKQPIVAGKETNNGNFLLPDISGTIALQQALILGLADNTSRRQIGVTLKHSGHYSHGYKFTFQEVAESSAREGRVNGFYSYTVLNIQLDIEPVDSALRPPTSSLPADLPDSPARKAIEAVVFRGIMQADERRRFRPREPLTRAELASAIAATIHLEPARSNPPVIRDVAFSPDAADAIALVVGAGIMSVDRDSNFLPTKPVTRPDAAAALSATSKRCGATDAPAGAVRPLSDEHITRQETAETLYKLLGFTW